MAEPRIFNSIGEPVIIIREFNGWAVTIPPEPRRPTYRYTGGEIGEVKERGFDFNKDSTVHKNTLSGATSEWIKHISLSGSFVIPKLTWQTAQLLMKAFSVNQNGYARESLIPEDTIVLLKIYSKDDPYFLPVRLSSPMSLPGVASKIVIGHKCVVNWQTMQPIDRITTNFDAVYNSDGSISTLREIIYDPDIPVSISMAEFYYALMNPELTTW